MSRKENINESVARLKMYMDDVISTLLYAIKKEKSDKREEINQTTNQSLLFSSVHHVPHHDLQASIAK